MAKGGLLSESIVTLGEFKMPHRVRLIEEMLWSYHTEGDLYLCQQKAQTTVTKNLSLSNNSIESEF